MEAHNLQNNKKWMQLEVLKRFQRLILFIYLHQANSIYPITNFSCESSHIEAVAEYTIYLSIIKISFTQCRRKRGSQSMKKSCN